jgi:hypothetical protein
MHAWCGDAQDLRRGGFTQRGNQFFGDRHRFGQITDSALIVRCGGLHTEHAGIRLFGLRAWAKEGGVAH